MWICYYEGPSITGATDAMLIFLGQNAQTQLLGPKTKLGGLNTNDSLKTILGYNNSITDLSLIMNDSELHIKEK